MRPSHRCALSARLALVSRAAAAALCFVTGFPAFLSCSSNHAGLSAGMSRSGMLFGGCSLLRLEKRPICLALLFLQRVRSAYRADDRSR